MSNARRALLISDDWSDKLMSALNTCSELRRAQSTEKCGKPHFDIVSEQAQGLRIYVSGIASRRKSLKTLPCRATWYHTTLLQSPRLSWWGNHTFYDQN